MSRAIRSLSEGLQTGLQLGRTLRDARMGEELAKAYGLTPEQQQAAMATPEQLQRAQAEAQALQQQDITEFGLTPQEAQQYAPAMPQEGMRVGPSTYRLGGQTFQQAPSQEQIDAARMRAAADVYGRYGDVAKREELMRGLRAEERATAAERRAQTGFETQQQQAALTLRALGRAEDAETRYNAFSQFAAQNPNMSAEELRSAARTQFNFTPEQELKFINTRLGLQEGELKAFDARIKSKIKGKSLTQLGTLYNTDADFDDSTDLSIVPGKNGAVTLNFIDKKSGRTVASNSFGSEALAVEYLGKQATDPLNAGTWLLGVKTKEADIQSKQAYARRLDALAGTADDAKGLEKKFKDAEAVLGRNLTEQERLTLVGLVPKPREVSDSAIASYAKELIGTPTGRLDKDGKPERYTAATAPAAARSILSGQETTTGMPSWGAGAQQAPAKPAAPAAPRAAAPAAPVPGQIYGMLTPMSRIQADAAAGVPGAIAYLQALEENRIQAEMQRQYPGIQLGLQ